MTLTMGQVFLSEFFGTFILILLGAGVCAAVTLPKSKAQASGWVVITFGWGLAVFMGVYAAYATGGHLNPAVTIGLAAAGRDLAPGVPATAATVVVYVLAQTLGAVLGAVGAWLAYKKHFDEDAPAAAKLGCFATAPGIRSYGWNVVTELLGTFALVAWVLYIGMSLGGPTGYAINPARDLGPRIAHALLPIKGKGGSDWAYSWVPVLGPVLGALAAGLLIPRMAGLY